MRRRRAQPFEVANDTFQTPSKGGHEIHESGINTEIALTLLVAILIASIVPIYSFFILKLKLDAYNAAAIAATYGSISAVTFVGE